MYSIYCGNNVFVEKELNSYRLHRWTLPFSIERFRVNYISTKFRVMNKKELKKEDFIYGMI